MNAEATSIIPTFEDVEAARQLTLGVLTRTPLAGSEYLSNLWGCRTFFKLENLQSTGSFKERGALNKLLNMPSEDRSRGVIAASAGNHGQALAFHAKKLGVPASIAMPTTTPLIKVQNTASHGARVLLQGNDYDEAAAHAREVAKREGLTYVSGFDDPDIIAGQGIIGLEILEQCASVDTVIVPVGGGGLIAGIAMALKETNPRIRVVGVQAEGVPSMIEALKRGEPVEVPACRTIADGIAVRKVGALPLELVKRYVDDIVTVTEEEVANAILLLLEREKAVVEGAGAAGVAAVHNGRISVVGQKIAIVLSGGNIDVNVVARIIDKGLVKDGRLVKLRVLVPDHPGQLASLLEIVARKRANILEVTHNRALSAARVGETQIDMVLETRGPAHIQEIQDEFANSGYKVAREAYPEAR